MEFVFHRRHSAASARRSRSCGWRIGSRSVHRRIALTASPLNVEPLYSAVCSSHCRTCGGVVTSTRLLPSAAFIGITPLTEVITITVGDSEPAQPGTEKYLVSSCLLLDSRRVLFWTARDVHLEAARRGVAENNFQLAYPSRRAPDSFGGIAGCLIHVEVTPHIQAASARRFSPLAL
jgi:hypothetical protein